MRQRRWTYWLAALAVAVAPAGAGLTTATALAARAATVTAKHPAAARGDFDGDGKADLVAAAPGGGRVRVVYTKAKPGGSHSQWIDEPGGANGGFGTALAVGDFNGDGFADLAVGAPGYTASDTVEEGAVFVFWGSKSGLHDTGTMFHGPDDFDDDNEFGTSLSAGLVNADGFADLAVGNPGPAGGGDSEGSAQIFFGSAAGLSYSAWVGLGSASPVENGDFGQAVLLADVNGDGHADLVVGEPGGGAGAGGPDPSGDIQVFLATAKGLGPHHTTISGAKVGVALGLGLVLAAGDINSGRAADVVAGDPEATAGGHAGAGKIVVLYGGKHGLSAARHRDLSEATPHVAGAAKTGARFGAAVAVADLNGDGHAEVLIGVPGARVTGKANAGAVVLLVGRASGVTARHSELLTQATKGIPGTPRSGAGFGSAVGTIRSAGGGHRNLLAGAPGQPPGGLLVELHGGPNGVTTKDAIKLTDAGAGDGFGAVLAL